MMKLTTIIIGILVLAGCAGIGYQTLNMSREMPSTSASESTKGQVKIPIEVTGGGPPRHTPAAPLPAPPPVASAPSKKPGQYYYQSPTHEYAPGSPPRQSTIRKLEKQDDVQSNLFTASLAFVLRDKANVSEDIKAQLLIDPTQGIEQLEKELTVKGQKISKEIEVSKIVIAKITAPDFDVVPITPEEQILSLRKPTEWLWTLSPKSTGTFEVNLTVTAVINARGRETTHHLKTFDKTIVVEITTQQVIKHWFGKNWQWVIGTIIIPLLVFFFKDYVLGLLKRKKKS